MAISSIVCIYCQSVHSLGQLVTLQAEVKGHSSQTLKYPLAKAGNLELGGAETQPTC